MLNVSGIEPKEIADALKLSEAETWKFARHMEAWFKPRRMQAVGRKHRPIDPPHKGPKKLLKRLHLWFQRKRLYHPRAHGGIQQRSCFTSAACHLGPKYIWTRDASNCYPSVSPKAFYSELRVLGFRDDTARLLTLLCTVRGAVPQGSPVSGDALNLFFYRIDQAVSSFGGAHRLSLSQVVDDFVISGKDVEKGFRAARLVEEFLRERGIAVNRKKRKEAGFQPRSGKQQVHNINVRNRRGTAINPEQRAKAIRLAQRYADACKSLKPDSLEGVAALRAQLQGWMHYCRQAHLSPAKHLRRQMEAGDRTVRRTLRHLGISAHQNKWWLVSNKHNEPRRIAAVWTRVARSRASPEQ